MFGLRQDSRKGAKDAKENDAWNDANFVCLVLESVIPACFWRESRRISDWTPD
jgi:hypothetical protein